MSKYYEPYFTVVEMTKWGSCNKENYLKLKDERKRKKKVKIDNNSDWQCFI